MKKVEEQRLVFQKSIIQRIEDNKNAIIVLNGSTGSGKSYASLRLGYDLSKDLKTSLSIKNNVDFNFQKLLLKMELKINQKPGTIFIMEEVGAFGSGASSREWQSEANKFFFSFLQTSRHRNQILIMNCPNFSYLEKGCRELVHYQLEAISINYANKQCYFRPYVVQVNTRTGKMYFKFIRYYKKDNPYVRIRLTKYSFELPPKHIIKAYELAKIEYTTNLNKSMLNPQKKKQENLKAKYDDERKNTISNLLDKGLSNKDIADIIGVSMRTIQIHNKAKKGVVS